MTVTNPEIVAVGLQQMRIYQLTAGGYPNATGTTVYEGLQIQGAQSFDLTVPDARRIGIKGDNRLLATLILPRQEPSSGKLTFSANNHDAYAIMTATKRASIGSASVVGYGTSEQGSEPIVGVLAYQAGQDLNTNAQKWRGVWMPAVKPVVKSPSMNDNQMSFECDLTPSGATHNIYGPAFTVATDGYTSAETVETVTTGIPHCCAWLGDNVATEFSFHADRPAQTTAQINQIISVAAADGTVTDITATATKAVGKITPASKPATGDLIVCFYEYAA